MLCPYYFDLNALNVHNGFLYENPYENRRLSGYFVGALQAFEKIFLASGELKKFFSELFKNRSYIFTFSTYDADSGGYVIQGFTCQHLFILNFYLFVEWIFKDFLWGKV